MGKQKVIIKRDGEGKFIKSSKPTKDVLEELYIIDRLTPSKMAEVFGVSHNTVRRWMAYYEISQRRPYTSYLNLNLSEATKAYFAGYLDGDGTVCINRYKSKRSRNGYGVHIDVAMITKYKFFADQLQNLVGGRVGTFIYKDSRRKKTGYRLGFNNQASALAFLKEIEPYLILKKELAQLAIKFLELRIEDRKIKGNSAIISDEALLLVNEVRKINNERRKV